jgi:hypothetical protein
MYAAEDTGSQIVGINLGVLAMMFRKLKLPLLPLQSAVPVK